MPDDPAPAEVRRWLVYEDRTSTTLLPAGADPAAYPWDGPAAIVYEFDAADEGEARRLYSCWMDGQAVAREEAGDAG